MVRTLRFKRYAIAGSMWTHGTLKDLLLAMPYVLLHFIPPLRILNDLLARGLPNDDYPDGMLPDGNVQVDMGMSGGCAWKPFQIALEEYEGLVVELLTDPALTLRISEPPEGVLTIRQWVYWALNQPGR